MWMMINEVKMKEGVSAPIFFCITTICVSHKKVRNKTQFYHEIENSIKVSICMEKKTIHKQNTEHMAKELKT